LKKNNKMDCSECTYWVYEKDTGLGYCKIDNDPQNCDRFYSKTDAKNDAKYGNKDRY